MRSRGAITILNNSVRLPAKDRLRSRGVITTSNNSLCVMCNSHGEDMVHLFFSCAIALAVWRNIANLLDIFAARNGSVCPTFCFRGEIVGLRKLIEEKKG